MKTVKSREPRIAVLVDTSTGWGRRLIRGVLMYAKRKGDWQVIIEARGQDEPFRLPPSWEGEGVISRVSTPASAKALSKHQPVVNVSSILLKESEQFPRVNNDTQACAELAVEHLLDRGLRNFAYCSIEQRSFVDFHQNAFCNELSKRGYECDVYKPMRGCGPRSSWSKQMASLGNWLRALPKPVGIHTWAIRSGIQVINVCHELGIFVPDQVSVIGGDEDDLLCEAGHPPLTGVETPSEQIGLEAAELLDRLMRGESSPTEPRYIPPTGVIARQSTDILAIEDPDLVGAVRFIRNNPEKQIQVDDVVNAVHVSRRSLERRFAVAFNRSIREEITRVHLQRAKMLLAQTEMAIPAVADASGHGSPEYFATSFKAATGTTPLKYRARVRGRQ